MSKVIQYYTCVHLRMRSKLLFINIKAQVSVSFYATVDFES